MYAGVGKAPVYRVLDRSPLPFHPCAPIDQNPIKAARTNRYKNQTYILYLPNSHDSARKLNVFRPGSFSPT